MLFADEHILAANSLILLLFFPEYFYHNFSVDMIPIFAFIIFPLHSFFLRNGKTIGEEIVGGVRKDVAEVEKSIKQKCPHNVLI